MDAALDTIFEYLSQIQIEAAAISALLIIMLVLSWILYTQRSIKRSISNIEKQLDQHLARQVSTRPVSNDYRNNPQQSNSERTPASRAAHTDARLPVKEPEVRTLVPKNESDREDFSQLEFTQDFTLALKALEGDTSCIFITGEAGTGKSTLLKYFTSSTDKKLVVLAPTGVAAVNAGGVTIHKFFRWPARPLNPDEIKKIKESEICQQLDAIVIDEISMVRSDLMDNIDRFLRLNGRDPGAPFGGIQMVFFGDLFQLPPVVSSAEEGQFFGQYYKSPYFFDAHVFDEMPIEIVKLSKVFRQRDQDFVDILNRLRLGRYDGSDLEILNSRTDVRFEPPSGHGWVTLTTTNKLANEKNQVELKKLSTPQFNYVADITGDFDRNSFPTDLVLNLKVGAQVMFVRNDTGHRWVNGTIGTIHSLAEDGMEVQIPVESGQPPCIYEVPRITWEVTKYRLNHHTRSIESEVVGTFTQYPIRLAWAITIHRSQGKTLDRVVINLGRGAFAHGQAYVALSRCTSLDQLILRQKVRKEDIIVDRRVFGFLVSVFG